LHSNNTATDNDIAISIIDAPDFNADVQCTFYSAGEKAIALSVNGQGLQQLLIGPPQPITAVSCTGTCVATYGMLCRLRAKQSERGRAKADCIE